MAEGSANVSCKSLEQLEREITCGVCQEHYTEPKLLPCLHYYCKKCVLDLALKARPGKSFPCPECPSKATLPEEGVDGLKTAFFVNHLKTILSSMTIIHGQVEYQCEACLEVYNEKAEAFCHQCAAFICAECVKSHKKCRQYSKHEISSLDDLKQGKCKPVERKEHLPEKCEDHDEPQVIYCYDCDTLICRDCIMKDHKEHNFEFCKKAARNAKRELSQELQPLKKLKIEYLHAAKLVQTTKQEVEDQGLSVAKEKIKTAFSELHQIWNEQEKELLQEAETKVGKKVEKLCEQEKMLTRASVEIQGVVGYTEQCLSLCTDTEIMGLQAETKTKIRRETEEHSKMNLEPAEEGDIGVAVCLADDLKQLCQDKAKIVPVINFQESTNSLLIPQSVQVQDTLELALQLGLILQNDRSSSKIPHLITAVIKSEYSGTTSVVIANAASRYSIRYKVADRGRHEVVVLVDGERVPGSPFFFVASLPPTKLGQPIKVWNQVSIASAITTNSAGDILVTEKYGDILKFGKNGSRQTLVRKSSHSLNFLRGIAVDSDDNIYCTDEHSSKILKCNKNGGNVLVSDTKQERGEGHIGVVVVGKEVLACAAGVDATILVYDRNLEYVRELWHTEDGGWFYDISADSQHNLYVADYSKHVIYVFSIDGTHLRSIEDYGERVYGPYSVHVFQQHVYIGNYTDTISVFTTDGTHVNTFGSHGSAVGQICKPFSITVGEDGLVYVAEYGNDRVQCF